MGNKVIAGRLSGCKIKLSNGIPKIMINLSSGIPIDRSVVQRMQILNIESHRKILDGFIRGLLGKLVGTTMYLSAIESAKSNYLYLCKLIYRDNSCSTIQINSSMFKFISANVDIS